MKLKALAASLCFLVAPASATAEDKGWDHMATLLVNMSGSVEVYVKRVKSGTFIFKIENKSQRDARFENGSFSVYCTSKDGRGASSKKASVSSRNIRAGQSITNPGWNVTGCGRNSYPESHTGLSTSWK